jgi:hypothetical protein
MDNLKGALTIAEGDIKFKTDVSLAFGGNKIEKQYVLRTSLDQLSVWKAKYVKTAISPFAAHLKTIIKEAAIIDKEVWVFGIDSTKSQDIVTAVQIACNWYKVAPDKFLTDVYIKNLNAERDTLIETQTLVEANKKLYTKVCSALVDAAHFLKVKGALNLWVVSSVINHKIPKNDLHESLKAGGAVSVDLDPTPHIYTSVSNDGLTRARVNTNLHLAKFSL